MITIERFVELTKIDIPSKRIFGLLDRFVSDWESHKQPDWPEQRLHSEWRYEFIVYIESGANKEKHTCPYCKITQNHFIKKGWNTILCYPENGGCNKYLYFSVQFYCTDVFSAQQVNIMTLDEFITLQKINLEKFRFLQKEGAIDKDWAKLYQKWEKENS